MISKKPLTLVATGATALAMMIAATSFAQQRTVAVSQIVEHPALDATRNGLLKGLEDAGFKDGANLEFKFQTAQGKPDIAAQIAQQFVSENPDVLVGIATPTAQALAAATESIPVVFTAVTDPVGAKLLKSMSNPDGNVTGISDLSPVRQHVETMLEIKPSTKKIGVVYNPGEANSISLVELLKKAGAEKNVGIVEGTATRTSEIPTATQSVASEADIIYAITDNTLASAIAAMTSIANDANVPVFAAETSFVDDGALAAVGFDYYQIGYQTAEYVAAILNGKSPSELPARVATGTNIVINLGVAKKLGINLPASLASNPTRTVN